MDGRLGPDGGELGVVAQHQPLEDHVLDDGVEQEVHRSHEPSHAQQNEQACKDNTGCYSSSLHKHTKKNQMFQK